MERALDPNAFELRSLDFLSRSRSEAPVAEELEDDIFTSDFFPVFFVSKSRRFTHRVVYCCQSGAQADQNTISTLVIFQYMMFSLKNLNFNRLNITNETSGLKILIDFCLFQ